MQNSTNALHNGDQTDTDMPQRQGCVTYPPPIDIFVKGELI